MNERTKSTIEIVNVLCDVLYAEPDPASIKDADRITYKVRPALRLAADVVRSCASVFETEMPEAAVSAITRAAHVSSCLASRVANFEQAREDARVAATRVLQ
jgi:hypothetical protein